MDNDSEEQLLKILSNPIRATIVKKLYDDTLTFTHLMQLTGCKTGQLSFHLKKLDYLVEQDELKRYRLSEKGKEDVEALLPMLGNGEKENGNSWDNLSGEGEGAQLGCAFKQFWDSLGLLIFSFLASIKHGVLYILGHLKAGTLKLFENVGKISSSAKAHFTGEKSEIRAVGRGGKAGFCSIKRKTGRFFSALPGHGASALKTSRRSLNPIFCYSFLVLGLLLFIPAVFSYAHPAFDSTLDSAAKIGLKDLTPGEISLVNDLYAKEMLPDQLNFQGESDSLMYDAMYYGKTVGFPLSAQKIKNWNEEKAFSRVRLVKDSMISCLSLSLILLLLGGVLAYRRNAVLRRALNSVITASILLILISVFGLLNINAVFASNYSHLDSVFTSVPIMLKHLIALLLLFLFSSAAGLLFLVKKGSVVHTKDEPLETKNVFSANPDAETSASEVSHEGEGPSDDDLSENLSDNLSDDLSDNLSDDKPTEIDSTDMGQVDVEEKTPAAGASVVSEETLTETESENLYARHERDGAING